MTINTPQKGLHSLIDVQIHSKNVSYLLVTVPSFSYKMCQKTLIRKEESLNIIHITELHCYKQNAFCDALLFAFMVILPHFLILFEYEFKGWNLKSLVAR